MQKPHPTVWIPGGGSVETWQWCAQMDYVYAYLFYFGFKDGRATPPSAENYAEAIGLFERALAVDPRFPEAQSALSFALAARVLDQIVDPEAAKCHMPKFWSMRI